MKSKMLTKKSLILITLVLVILISLSFAANATIVASRLEAQAYQEEYRGELSADGQFLIEFKPDENGNKYGIISNFMGAYYGLKIADVPHAYNGIEIQNIEEEAFRTFEFLEEVIFPQTIRSIGDKAFEGCKNLKKVYAPASITKISDNAFNGTESFIMYVEKDSYAQEFAKKNQIDFKVYTPEDLKPEKQIKNSKAVTDAQYKNIGYDIFYNNDVPCCAIAHFSGQSNTVSDVVIPNQINNTDVTAVMDEAIINCDNIETITLPKTVTFVGTRAFAECDLLKKVYFPNSVTCIGADIFKEAPNATICAEKNSYAHQYAIKNNIKFEEQTTTN